MRSAAGQDGVWWSGLLMCAAAASLGGCVTSMYPGQRRPDSETIVVGAEGTTIDSIDDVPPPKGSRFRLLPGTHRVELYLSKHIRTTVPVCFTGQPGHSYLARLAYAGGTWRPEILDERRMYPITSNDCSSPVRRDLARAAPVAAPEPAPVPNSPDGGIEADGSAATAVADPPALPAAPIPAASPPAATSHDAEVPRASLRPDFMSPQSFMPWLDFGAELGLVQGGEELVTATDSGGNTETLGTGDGLLLALGVRFTPLWLSDRAGFGVGGGAGLKYWSVGGNGGEASMFKYLLTASGHVMFPITPTWLVILQGGIEKDFGIDLSINGAGSGVPFESRVGFVGALGFQHALDESWSFAFSLRATILDYAVQGNSVGANSVGLIVSIHYGL